MTAWVDKEGHDSWTRGKLPFPTKEESKVDGYKVKGGWFFDMDIDGEQFSFNSKWNPPIVEIMKTAEMYDFEFTNEYAELDCDIYGKYKYENGILWDKYLKEIPAEDDSEESRYDLLDDLLAQTHYEEVTLEE